MKKEESMGVKILLAPFRFIWWIIKCVLKFLWAIIKFVLGFISFGLLDDWLSAPGMEDARKLKSGVDTVLDVKSDIDDVRELKSDIDELCSANKDNNKNRS